MKQESDRPPSSPQPVPPASIPAGAVRPPLKESESRPAPGEREIAERAYARWEKSGRVHGQDQEHWYGAEREIHGESESRAGRPPSKASSPFASDTPPDTEKSVNKT